MANSFYELKDFAFATVMDVSVFPSEVFFHTDGDAYTEPNGQGQPVLPIAKLDSLTMSNITQEGPEKETRGGTANEPIIRFRKTVRLEMEDVVVTPPALRALFGAVVFDEAGQRIDFSNYDPATTKVTGFAITDTFAKMISLRGKTFVIERETGERRWIDITFNRFLPDSVLDMMMEAEGDLGVVNVAGELFPNDCGEYFVLGRIPSPQCAEEDDDALPTPTGPQA